nr:MAG TPA: hypothetical protein [Caudoviricetes sp.]DAT52954.1 MAG TPA: hypothetical protein [Caudoviricetes sp.]
MSAIFKIPSRVVKNLLKYHQIFSRKILYHQKCH